MRQWHATRAAHARTLAGAEARLLRAILNTAVVDKIIADNPVPAPLTRTKTGVKHRPPTLDELGVILDNIEPRFRLAVILGAYGGARISEWRALRRRDIEHDGKRHLVRIERQAQYVGGAWIVGPPKSAESTRLVPLPAGASGELERHLAEHVGPSADDLLFAPGPRSRFLHDRQFTGTWNRAREAAGVRLKNDEGKWVNLVREHDLRAFAGTMHAQTGATLRETMAFLGHSTTAAAMAYQATTGRDAELADRMPWPVRASPTESAQT